MKENDPAVRRALRFQLKKLFGHLPEEDLIKAMRLARDNSQENGTVGQLVEQLREEMLLVTVDSNPPTKELANQKAMVLMMSYHLNQESWDSRLATREKEHGN